MTDARKRMQPRGIATLALLAIAASFATPARELHNLVLLVSESLPAASVEESTAPTLARLKAQGVNFINSHSGFPGPVFDGETAAAADLQLEPLTAAAKANYSTLLMDDSHVELSSAGEMRRSSRRAASLGAVLAEALPTFKSANQPFLIIYQTTNIIVAAEHGRSTALKHSQTSLSLGITYPTGMSGALPPGFLAVDLMHALQAEDSTLSLFDPDTGNRRLDWAAGQYPIKATGIIATDPAHPLVEIEARGGHDLIYFSEHLSRRESSRLGQIIVETLLEQDYVSGLFVDEKRLGKVRGALSLQHIGWNARAGSRMPAIAVGFVSYTMGCSQPTVCSATIADSPLGEGQPVRGVFSRADTWNFMAARGPDFRSAVTSRVPASNADVARTIAELLRLELDGTRRYTGRVLLEALRGYERGGVPAIRQQVIASKPSIDGMVTEVHLQLVGSVKYFDAAGFPGLAVGVPAHTEAFEEPRGGRWRLPKVRRLRIEISPD